MTAPVRLPEARGLASQATAIEQSRAIAEVQAAVLVAQQCPRDEDRAIAAMQRACARTSLAGRAFYEFPRGREKVVGATVYLARELARIWGNIDFKVAELSRQSDQSEMLAIAWDLQTNTRASTSWIVPNRRYTGGGGALTELRDIYENNANTGARRVREQIFAVLPQWFTEDAQDVCRETLRRCDGKPLDERRDAALEKFGELGITASQLATRVGRPPSKWTADDLATLGITLRSIEKGEISKAEAFPSAVVTIGELGTPAATAATERPAPEPPSTSPAPTPAVPDAGGTAASAPEAAAGETPAPLKTEPASSPEPADRPAIASQKARIAKLCRDDAQLDDAGRLALVSALIDRPVASTNELGMREAATVIGAIEELAKSGDLPKAVEDYLRLYDQVQMENTLAAEQAATAAPTTDAKAER